MQTLQLLSAISTPCSTSHAAVRPATVRPAASLRACRASRIPARTSRVAARGLAYRLAASRPAAPGPPSRAWIPISGRDRPVRQRMAHVPARGAVQSACIPDTVAAWPARGVQPGPEHALTRPAVSAPAGTGFARAARRKGRAGLAQGTGPPGARKGPPAQGTVRPGGWTGRPCCGMSDTDARPARAMLGVGVRERSGAERRGMRCSGRAAIPPACVPEAPVRGGGGW